MQNRMTSMIVGAIILSLVFAGGAGALTRDAQPEMPAPDWILFNGKIATVDASNSFVQAVAIRDGKILAVGRNGLVQSLWRPGTQIIDLKGRTVIPGLIDAHLHGLRNGYHCFSQTVRLDLITSRAEALAAYQAKAAQLADDRWIWTTFGGWNVNQLDTPGMFTLAELDAAVPDNPLYIQGTGFSGVQVNSRALEVLGLEPGDPGVEPTGRLTGPAIGAANAAVLAQLNAHTIEQQAECLADFIRTSNRLGLTAWKDPDGNTFPWITSGPEFGEFSQGLHGHQPLLHLHRNDELNARVAFHQMPNFGGLEQVQADTRNAIGFIGDDMVRYMGVGEDLADVDAEEYAAITQYVAANRLGFEHHATASDEIDFNLAGFEAANEVFPIADLNWTIAHPGDDLPTDEQLARGLALGIGWTPSISSVRNGAPGPRFRTIMENSAHMCLITDAMNVAPWVPFQKLWYVVSGNTLLPGMSGVPEDQRLTREEALRHSTVECAWFLAQDGRLGSLEVGKHADLIVLSADYFTVPVDNIRNITSVLTMVGGKIVFAGAEFAGLDPSHD